jgi:hypothetical protein
VAPDGDQIAELRDRGFCVLKAHFDRTLVENCRAAFWPILLEYLDRNRPKRGEHRHFLAMPFDPPCFAPEFFFDGGILGMVRSVMDKRMVADQWGCDVPLKGATYQQPHFGLPAPFICRGSGFAASNLYVGGQLWPDRYFGGARSDRDCARHSADAQERGSTLVESGAIELQPVTLDLGDVLMRHPWALHRGTPNVTD